MTRMLAFMAALLMTAISVTSACVANTVTPLQFTLEPSGQSDRVQVRFYRSRDRGSDSWSTSFRTSELAGLDLAALRSAGTRPLRFAVIRDAGRVDCAGSGGSARASGSCTIAPDPAFSRLLAAHGIGEATDEQSYALIAVDVRRDLVVALKTGNYAAPTVDKLIELSAVGVTPAYIRELSARGYRPRSLNELVEFSALEITPDFIAGFALAGYSNLAPQDLVQLKAMDITPQFVAGFERLGYRNLPVSTLVQLKAMDVTPAFVGAIRQGGALPSPDRLVQIRAVTEDIRKN